MRRGRTNSIMYTKQNLLCIDDMKLFRSMDSDSAAQPARPWQFLRELNESLRQQQVGTKKSDKDL